MHPVNTIPKRFVKQIAIAAAFLFVSSLAFVQNSPSVSKGAALIHVTGPFDVKVTPQDDKSDDPLLSRMTLDKQYHGDLEATAIGQMLAAGTAVEGSGAYVAIEKVTGTLQGRTGTFILQHLGTMARTVPQLTI